MSFHPSAIGRGLLAAAVLLLLSGLVRPPLSDPGGGSRHQNPPLASREFCSPERNQQARYLNEAAVDSMGRRISLYNLRLFQRTDSLYRAGVFGPPGSPEASEKACLHLQLRVQTGMTYIRQLTSTGTLAVDEASLAHPFGQIYENYGVYPISFLQRAVAGEGGFCLHYNFPRHLRDDMLMGGIKVPTEVDTVSYEGGPEFQAISMDYPTSQYKTVQLLYAPIFSGRVTSETVVDAGDTLEVQVMDDLDGLYVRRWGLHCLRALAIWRTVTHGDADPPHPRVGAAAYFPHLQLRMPFFLPDLGFSDLRSFDLPAPILFYDWFQNMSRNHPRWVEITSEGNFLPWKEVGPRPAMLDRRFPDL